MSSGPKRKIDVSDVRYYFDAQEKNSLDGSQYCLKSRAILALRDRLLTLPDKDFDSAIRTLHGLLDQNTKAQGSDDSVPNKAAGKDALSLYEQGSSGSTNKINPI